MKHYFLDTFLFGVLGCIIQVIAFLVAALNQSLFMYMYTCGNILSIKKKVAFMGGKKGCGFFDSTVLHSEEKIETLSY